MATATGGGLTTCGETSTVWAMTVSEVQIPTGEGMCVSRATIIAPMIQAGGAVPPGAMRLGLVSDSRAETPFLGVSPQLGVATQIKVALQHGPQLTR